MTRRNHETKPHAARWTAGHEIGDSDRSTPAGARALAAGGICLAVSLVTFLLLLYTGELLHRRRSEDLIWLLSQISIWTALLGRAMAGAALWRGPSVVRYAAIGLLVLQAPLFFRVASWLIERALVM